MTKTAQERRRARVAVEVVKVLHTVVWAFFAGSIVGIPVAAWMGRFGLAGALSGVVAVECAVLAGNGMRCPMTDWAARYTDERAANFDIYLPEWLARHNQRIFGVLYVVGMLAAVVMWMSGKWGIE